MQSKLALRNQFYPQVFNRFCGNLCGVSYGRLAVILGRSLMRYTNFKADQISSTAQIFTSTNPAANPTSRTMFSLTSVGTPDVFFGQEIHNMPFGFIRRA